MKDTLESRDGMTWASIALAAGLWIAAVWAGWPYLLRPWASFQINYNEGWNAYRAQAALQHALYAHPPVFSVTNYPPLSFHLVGLLVSLIGDPVTSGRIVSLISLAAICAGIAFILRRVRTSVAGCIAGAALFVIMLELYCPSYIGVDDPQLLGMSFETAGLCCLLWRLGPGQGAMVSAFLFSIALFTKPNLLAFPIGVGLGMAQGREWKRLSLWLATGAVCGAGLYLAAVSVDGPCFRANVLCPRAYFLKDAMVSSALYGLALAPFFILSLIWSCRNLFLWDGERRVLALAWFAAHGLGMIFLGGDGVFWNMMFEALLLDAVIVVLACRDWFGGQVNIRVLMGGLLLGVLMVVPLSLFMASEGDAMTEWHETQRLQVQFASGVDLLEAASGPVVCENLLMCFRAERASAFDSYFVMDQIKVGKMPDAEITGMVNGRKLGAVEIGDTNLPARKKQIRFTKSFMAALHRNYRLAMQTPQFSIWEPRSP